MRTMRNCRVNWYITKASECEKKANQAQDQEVKRGFADLAQQWTEIAAQVGRQSAGAPPDPAAWRFKLADSATVSSEV